MRKLAALMLLVLMTGPVLAWNDRGHMVVARRAWYKLADRQRAQVVTILKKHPHYETRCRNETEYRQAA